MSSNIAPTVWSPLRRGLSLISISVLAVGIWSGPLSCAQTEGVGTISGRVFNPVTREYVNNAEITIEGTTRTAYSAPDGTYKLLAVPAGQKVLVVNYTGYNTSTATVNVQAGRDTVQNFELDSGILVLDAFTISAEKEGSAKVIMDQRAALNFKNIMASDSFGENPDGNVGEFLKLMPGITIDYAFIQARGVRLAGMDPKYSSMTVDGIDLSSAGTAAFGAASRAVELDAFSITGVEAVEMNKTATADMDATAVSGNINLRSKNAFEREGRLFTYNISMSANEYAIDFDKTPGWLQETQRKVTPNWSFGYADVFLNKRLGVQINYSDSTRWTPRDIQSYSYDFSAITTRGPIINELRFGDEAVMVRSTTFGINADFKATDRLVLSLKSTHSQRELPGLRRIFRLITSAARTTPESSLTRIVTTASGTGSRLEFTGDVLNRKLTTADSHALRFNYKHDNFNLTGGMDYSKGVAEYVDVSHGFFTIASMRLSSMSWMAERSDPFSNDWVVTQLSGRPWNDPASWNRDSAIANNIGSRERKGTTEKTAGYLDAIIPITIGHPIQLRTGIKTKQVDFKLRGVGAQNWSYVGPSTSQTDPLARIPTETLIYRNDPTMHGPGVPFSEWPRPDRQRLYQLYLSHPEYFTENAVANFREKLIYPRTVEEQINSAYVDASGDFGSLRLRTGLRYEKTEATGWTVEQKRPSTITQERPDLVSNTIEYVLYQYYNGEQRKTTSTYDDLFMSGGAKYRIRRNWDAQVSFSQGILRPNYNNIAGAISFNETNRTVSVPNRDLKPEHSTKYYAGVSTYFEPAGSLSVGVYVMRIKDLQQPGFVISQAEAGYSDYAEFNDFSFLTNTNNPATQETRGLEVDYRQQLTFLPGILKGLSIYGSYSRVIASEERLGVVNKSGSGGISFRYKDISARLNGTWQAEYLTAKLTTTTSNRYLDERTSLDTEVSYRIFKDTAIFINGRNISDAPFRIYNVPDATKQAILDEDARYGAYWTVGIKGRF